MWLDQVAEGRLICRRFIADGQVAVLIPAVGHGDVERAGEMLLAVHADVVHTQLVAGLRLRRRNRPHLLAEADVAAVQMVCAVVAGELIGHAVERKASGGDAVAIASDGVAMQPWIAQIAAEVIKAERNIVQMSVLIRNEDGGNDSAVIDHADGSTACVGHGVLAWTACPSGS